MNTSTDIKQILVGPSSEVCDATWNTLCTSLNVESLKKIGSAYETKKAVIGGVNAGVVRELEGIRRMGFSVDEVIDNEPRYNIGV